MRLLDEAPTQATMPATILDGDAAAFQKNFNRYAIEFSHHLAGHPLFELSSLLELSKSLPETDIHYDAGDIRIGQRWDEVPRTRLTVDQLIDRIENAGAWILLKRTNQFPEYAAVLDQTLSEAAKLVGPAFPTRMRMRTNVILITSPNRIASYHIDPDCNFLCQLRGDKILHVFDRYDREVLPETEIERFWALDKNAAVYKEQFQHRAQSYQLKPGVGVHIPVNAPHWVQNHNNVSITLAMSFQYPESALGNIYRWNYYQRKLGIRPVPPGKSIIRDSLKAWSLSGAIVARNAVRRVFKRSSH